jgi:PAS domain S-box-containing protein
MRIKNRLRLNSAIIVILLLIMTAVLIWSVQTTTVADANFELAGKMQKSASGRLLVRDDYLLQHSERARIQWESETEAFRGLLAQAWDQLPAVDAPILDGIESDFAATVSLFHQIVEVRETQVSAGTEGLPSAEGEQRLVSQLLLQAYSLNDRISELRDVTQTTAGAAHTLMMWLMVSFIIGAAIATLVNSTLIQRLLTRRIERLREGIDIIGAGHLDHRIPVTGNDELSDLARAGNAMAAQLMETTTSVENLQREIAERKQMEETIKHQLTEIASYYDNAPIGLAVFDAGLRYLRINRLLAEMNGIPAAEHVGKTVGEILPAFEEQAQQVVRAIITTGKPVTEIEFTGQTVAQPGVQRVWLEGWFPLKSDDNRITGFMVIVQDITERKQAEERLREALEELETTLHSIGDAVISTDLEGFVRQMNPVAEQLTGWPEAEAQGRPLEEVFHIVQEETHAPVENPVQRVLREGLIVGLANHTLLIDRNGVERPIADSGSPIRGEDSAALGVVLVFRDQSRERAAEKELHGLMERQQAILAAVPDIIMEVDRDKVYTWANQAGREFFGDDVIGHQAADYFEGEEDVYGVVQPLFDGSSPTVYVESRQRRKDGQIRLLAWWCRSLTDDRGNVTGALSSAQDITERKRADERLRESEERFKRISLVISDFAYSCRKPANGSYQTDWMTGAVERITGYSTEEVIDRNCWSFLVLPEDLPLFERDVTGLVPGQSSRGELRILHRSGEVRWLQTSTECLADPQDPSCHRIFGGCVDITERKQLEREMVKARTDFLYSVSHELKTPLFLMTAMMELIQSRPEEDRQRQFMAQEETWIRNLVRLRLLINNLVDSQRTADLGTQIHRVPTDLGALVQRATQDLDVFAVKQSLTWQMDLDALPDLPLDPEAIERTLHNLLTNAIKFSLPGGTVHVRLRAVPDRVVLEIEDHGKGIAEESLSDLFQPFSRSSSAIKAVIPGTGLGLYVSKILVEAHGGSISLRSEEGKGSTVTVTLPLRE